MMTTAERVKRYGARLRGEPVEKLRPGPPPRPRSPKPPRLRGMDRNVVWHSGNYRIRRLDEEYASMSAGFVVRFELQTRTAEGMRWRYVKKLRQGEELHALLEAIVSGRD